MYVKSDSIKESHNILKSRVALRSSLKRRSCLREQKPNHPTTSEVCSAAQSCPTLCDSVDCSPPGPSVHGILQARILEWAAMPSSRGSSPPREQTQVSSIAGGFFTIWASREAWGLLCGLNVIQHTKHWSPIWHTSALYVLSAAAAVLLTWLLLCILSPCPNVLGSYHTAVQTAQRMLDYRSAVQAATRDRQTQASKFCECVSLTLICKMRGNICLHHDENFTKGAHDWESIF